VIIQRADQNQRNRPVIGFRKLNEKFTMKTKSGFSRVPMIVGIIITTLMVLVFGTVLIGDITGKPTGQLNKIANALIHWYDDPTGFFISYLIGYAIVWWKPLWGSIILIAASILVTVINIDNPGFLIFALPALLVGSLYLVLWIETRRSNRVV
jgi:hypothetical protein